MAQQEVESPSVFEWYYTEPNTGIRETRYKQEKHLVQLNGKIYLGEKPQESLRVRLSDQSVQGMTEVMNESDVSAHTFYVDYNQGIITCDQSRANNSMICSYYAVGCTKISATRVVGRTNDGVQEDLQTMIDNGKDFIDMQTEYTSAKDLMDDLKATKTTCINEIDTEANAKKKEVQDKIDEADNKLYEIDNMVTNCVVTCFAGKLENDLLTIKDAYLNKDECFKVENGLLTFTAPSDGIYEFDGRCTNANSGGTYKDGFNYFTLNDTNLTYTLEHFPSRGREFIVTTNSSKTLTRKDENNLTGDDYYVDYLEGKVYFYSGLKGETVTIRYYYWSNALSISAYIGSGYLINIVNREENNIGETIRFNNTLMSLVQGQKITINNISSNFASKVDNVHFTIKFFSDYDRSISDATRPLFAGRLNDDLLTVKNGYINKSACVKDSSNSGYSYLTFIAPKTGVYEFDGRCTNMGESGSIVAKIGTLDGTSAYLINVINNKGYVGETIRFNNTLMSLPKGYKITIWGMSEDMSNKISNVHFTVQYLGAGE